ncbi:response regulator [Desulfamplus magnetovallimortis]|nr:response regulator [Desulfamplus magnetovallimortis]
MGNNETVMIIDDVAEQIEIATVILKKLGYRAVSASSGEEAITYLKSASVDILILDMVMEPGMDGLDTYKKILEIHPGQKAVIVSGYAENNRVKQLQRLGATHYVKKPYTIDKIGKALKEALEK